MIGPYFSPLDGSGTFPFFAMTLSALIVDRTGEERHAKGRQYQSCKRTCKPVFIFSCFEGEQAVFGSV